MPVLEQDDAAGSIARQAVALEQFGGLRRLGRAEAKVPVPVPRRDEDDGPLAERTRAVEENDPHPDQTLIPKRS